MEVSQFVEAPRRGDVAHRQLFLVVENSKISKSKNGEAKGEKKKRLFLSLVL